MEIVYVIPFCVINILRKTYELTLAYSLQFPIMADIRRVYFESLFFELFYSRLVIIDRNDWLFFNFFKDGTNLMLLDVEHWHLSKVDLKLPNSFMALINGLNYGILKASVQIDIWINALHC